MQSVATVADELLPPDVVVSDGVDSLVLVSDDGLAVDVAVSEVDVEVEVDAGVDSDVLVEDGAAGLDDVDAEPHPAKAIADDTRMPRTSATNRRDIWPLGFL